MVDKPPTERYIDIIVEGCQKFGVKQSHIDYLKSLPCQKRKDPADYDTLPVPPDARTYTMEEVVAGDGEGDNPLLTTVNGKVLKHTNAPAMVQNAIKANKKKGINSHEVLINTFLYEPKFGIIKTEVDVTKQVAAAGEDQVAMWNKGPQMIKDAKTEVVGLIEIEYKD